MKWIKNNMEYILFLIFKIKIIPYLNIFIFKKMKYLLCLTIFMIKIFELYK